MQVLEKKFTLWLALFSDYMGKVGDANLHPNG